MSAAPLPPIVDAGWLNAHRDAVVVADVRHYLDGRSGRAAYEAGHIPGAVFVGLDEVLAAPPSAAAGRHPLPAAEHFAAALGALGIGDDDAVVAYDDAGGAMAARLVWMLRAIGRDAALLDGGLRAWPGRADETAAPVRPSVLRTATPWPPDLLADADAVAAAGVPLLDARASERYRGEVEPLDARPGHIPGARNVPFAANLEADGRFQPAEAIRERLRNAGVHPGTTLIAYCGSGVTACHLLLALELSGLGPGRLYPGSWSQWSADPNRPAEK